MPQQGRRKFVLIDHTIADVSGHYYEYAVHVLRAAEQAGYEPVLATNRVFRSAQSDPWAVYPVYKYGFWSAIREDSGSDTGLAHALARARFRLRCAFRFSRWGMAWAARHEFGDFLLRLPVERASLVSLVLLTPVVLVLKALRFVLLLLLLPLLVLRALLVPLAWLARRKGIRRYTAALFEDFSGAARFFGHLWAQSNEMRKWWRQFRCLRRFASDTARLFARVPLGQDDIVFIPTVSNIELMGLSVFFDRRPATACASWHLLFRRNIYQGRASTYASQEPAQEGLRQAFLNFGRRLALRRVFFHTDTDELTAQYNRLGAVEFSTLPIPHSRRSVEAARGLSLRAIYVGDARGEKGYHHLPAIIQDLWPDYVLAGKLVFAVQSNYSIPHGEPEAAVARSQLQALPAGPVTLFTEPLSSREYQALLLSGDINLMLYDRANYYARSSGILVEALSAGMPVVVPSACWLERQFLAQTYRHLESWRERLPVARTFQARELAWWGKGPTEIPLPWEGELRAAHSGIASLVPAPPRSTYALVTLWFGGTLEEVNVAAEELGELELDGGQSPPPAPVRRHPRRLVEVERTSQTGLILLRLSGEATALALELASPDRQSQVVLRNVRVDFFTCTEDERLPLGAVGLAYSEVSEVPALLRDLVDHYPHYRATAQAFAGPWSQYHNSERLIRELEQASGQPQEEVAPEHQPVSAAAGPVG